MTTKRQSAMKTSLQSLRKRFAPTLISKALKELFTGLARTATRSAPSRAPLHRGFVLEPLEPRLLLSADLQAGHDWGTALTVTATDATHVQLSDGTNTTGPVALDNDGSGNSIVNISRDTTSALSGDTVQLDLSSLDGLNLSMVSGGPTTVLDFKFTGGNQTLADRKAHV